MAEGNVGPRRKKPGKPKHDHRLSDDELARLTTFVGGHMVWLKAAEIGDAISDLLGVFLDSESGCSAGPEGAVFVSSKIYPKLKKWIDDGCSPEVNLGDDIRPIRVDISAA